MTATLLLVHGAWHGAWCWDSLLAALDGVPVRTVDLPSVGGADDALGGLYDDAETVRAALADIEGPVVVVGHSYGGAVVTEAVTADSGVAHLVYLCAFQLDEGDSLLGSVGGEAPPWWEVHETSIVARTPEEVFYNGVSPELTARSVARLGRQSRASVEQPLTNVAWMAVPSTYVVCAQDQAIPVFAQEAMSKRAGEVQRLETGHSPFLSHPDELAGLLRSIAAQAG
jgi:pimeloyl-ACP methyl ester carboxylesterase